MEKLIITKADLNDKKRVCRNAGQAPERKGAVIERPCW